MFDVSFRFWIHMRNIVLKLFNLPKEQHVWNKHFEVVTYMTNYRDIVP